MNPEAIVLRSVKVLQQFFHDLENIGSLAPNERRLLGLTLQELAALPEITSDEDAAHFLGQLAGMRDRLTDPTQFESIALPYATMLRIAEFVLSGDAWDGNETDGAAVFVPESEVVQ